MAGLPNSGQLTNTVKATIPRMIAASIFGLALTTVSNTLEPAILGYKVLRLVPENPNTAIGVTTALGLLVATLVQPVIGVLSDRTHSPLGRRLPYFILGTVMVIACLYLLAAAPVFGVVLVVYMGVQFASNLVQAPAQALIPDLIPAQAHGRAAGVKAAVDIVGVLIGRAAGYVVAQEPNWGQWAIYAAVSIPVVVYLVALGVAWVGAREAPTAIDLHPPQHATARAAVADTLNIKWRDYPAFGWWFANRFLFWGALLILNTFLLTFAVQALGLPEAQAQSYVATLALVLGAGIAIITLPSGWLTDWVGRRPVVALAGVLAAVGTLGVLLLRDLTLILVAGAVVGLGAGMFVSANWALITEIVPVAEAARYLGIANVATTLGSLFGRSLGAAVIDPVNRATGSDAAGFYVVYGVAAGMFALSVVMVLLMPDPPKPNPIPD